MDMLNKTGATIVAGITYRFTFQSTLGDFPFCFNGIHVDKSLVLGVVFSLTSLKKS